MERHPVLIINSVLFLLHLSTWRHFHLAIVQNYCTVQAKEWVEVNKQWMLQYKLVARVLCMPRDL